MKHYSEIYKLTEKILVITNYLIVGTIYLD